MHILSTASIINLILHIPSAAVYRDRSVTAALFCQSHQMDLLIPLQYYGQAMQQQVMPINRCGPAFYVHSTQPTLQKNYGTQELISMIIRVTTQNLIVQQLQTARYISLHFQTSL